MIQDPDPHWEQHPYSEYVSTPKSNGEQPSGSTSDSFPSQPSHISGTSSSQPPLSAFYGVTPQAPHDQSSPYFTEPIPGHGIPTQAYNPPPAHPVPLKETIRQLPRLYLKVLTKPAVRTFLEEMNKASWRNIWIQLAIYALLSAVLSAFIALSQPYYTSFVTFGIPAMPLLNPTFPSNLLQTARLITLESSILQIVLVPLYFFIGVGVQYALAMALSGRGTFLTQTYTTALYQVPLNILSKLIVILLVFIPGIGVFIGGLISLLLFVYGIVLNIFSIMAVHRLSGGKASIVVIIPYVILFVLLMILGLILALFIFSFLASFRTG